MGEKPVNVEPKRSFREKIRDLFSREDKIKKVKEKDELLASLKSRTNIGLVITFSSILFSALRFAGTLEYPLCRIVFTYASGGLALIALLYAGICIHSSLTIGEKRGKALALLISASVSILLFVFQIYSGYRHMEILASAEGTTAEYMRQVVEFFRALWQ